MVTEIRGRLPWTWQKINKWSLVSYKWKVEFRGKGFIVCFSAKGKTSFSGSSWWSRFQFNLRKNFLKQLELCNNGTLFPMKQCFSCHWRQIRTTLSDEHDGKANSVLDLGQISCRRFVSTIFSYIPLSNLSVNFLCAFCIIVLRLS